MYDSFDRPAGVYHKNRPEAQTIIRGSLFYLGEIMKELKPPLTFNQQLDLLKSRNLIIKDDNEVLSFLKSNNYYRFSGYTFLFQNKNSLYDNISFNDIKYIYDFDSELRILLLKYLQIIEISCRTSIAYYFAIGCNDSGAHYNYNNFKNIKHHDEFLKQHFSYIKHNENLPFVRKHISDYSDLSSKICIDNKYFPRYRMPIWVAVEIMPIGSLSRFYQNIANKKIVANIALSVNSNAKCFYNWLHAISNLRNKCAHYDRLYCTTVTPNIKLSKKAYRELFDVSYVISQGKIFPTILIVCKMLTSELCENFIIELSSLFNVYFNIDISNIGFPSNWKEIILQYRKYNY